MSRPRRRIYRYGIEVAVLEGSRTYTLNWGRRSWTFGKSVPEPVVERKQGTHP